MCRPAKFGGAAHFTLRCARQLSDGSHQTPIVALVCNLGSSGGPDMQLQLMHHEVETLFHEYGHALSSLLSRTAFQHLSGRWAVLVCHGQHAHGAIKDNGMCL